MHAQEFVSFLANVLGPYVQEDELVSIDRYLAAAGLREKAQGRNYPDLKLTEALRILIGVMAARNPAQAAKDVSDYQRFRLLAHGIYTEKGDAAALKSYIGLSSEELEELELLEVLRRIVKHLILVPDLSGDLWSCSVQLVVFLDGPVEIFVGGELFRGRIQFTGAMDYIPHGGGFQRTSVIGKHELVQIGKNVTLD